MANSPKMISVSELWPTEGVVSEEKVEAWKEDLRSGRAMKPVEYTEIAGRKLIRDGNNRVRAWIEHHRDIGVEVPDIPAIPSNQGLPPSDWQGPLFAEHLGRGTGAFESLKKVREADYLEAQRNFAREVKR